MNTLTESWTLAWQLIVSADRELFQIVGLSLQVSAFACLVGAIIGLLLGTWLSVARFPGHGLLVWLVNTLLALPSVVVGLLVYLLLSRSGPLGEYGILFTPSAMVVAQSLLVTPLIAALSRRLVIGAMADGGLQLTVLGARRLTVSLLMLAHDRMGTSTILLTAFTRAIAEVGAVMIVGGNINGVTRVMTTTIALETSKGDLALALALGLVLLGVVGILNGLMALLQFAASAKASQKAFTPSQAAETPIHMASPTRLPPDATPLMELRDVSMRFGHYCALSDVSLTIRRGDRLVLVGANGSGKTTLLRVLHGLVPSEGIRRTIPMSAEDRMPTVAMLYQRPFLLNFSVFFNVWIALWLAGTPHSQRNARIAQALHVVGLGQQANRPARALSGGQQQRLGMARALALQPDILLLDEPTASLDPSAKSEIESLIERVATTGVTFVMSTHNLGQAKRLANSIAYLHAGKIVVHLPVDQFFHGPNLPQQAQLFLQGELGWKTT